MLTKSITVNHPKHIAIIIDGNRRWAKERHLPTLIGHQKGIQRVRNVLDWVRELNIRETTLYCFSMQNFKRSKEEIKYLMDIFEKNFIDTAKNPKVHRHKIGIKVIGRTYLLPKGLQKAIDRAIHATKDYHEYRVNFALAYGGQQEIVDAIKNLAKKVIDKTISIEEINEETINNDMYLPSSPDLIIRTGGDYRTSNFLTWQSIYSEWFFLQKTWPAFNKQDLISIVDEFKLRQRRFGS